MADQEQRLKAAVQGIERRDPALSQELRDVRSSAAARVIREVNEAAAEGAAAARPQLPPQMIQETIVLRTGRPVLAVKNDEPELVFTEAESEVWRERLKKASAQIALAVRAVGRIEVRHHPVFSWIGTGWLVDENVVVTNRHVAQEFGRNGGAGFVFKQGTQGNLMAASVDFLEEVDNAREREFHVTSVLHIEGDSGPDMAFLRVSKTSTNQLAAPIALAKHAPVAQQTVAVIGYPARDSRIPDQQLMVDIFGDVYDKKRLAPGQVIRSANASLEHDCSTLGGNSGSVVMDLETGAAVGLHFAGRFLQANFAVPAELVARRLREIRTESRPAAGTAARRSNGVSIQTTRRVSGSSRATKTIPVHITIDIGDPIEDDQPIDDPIAPAQPTPIDDADDGELILTEARPEDYVDREGYKPGFIGGGTEVAMPVVTGDPDDVLTFEFKGETTDRLDYQHYSVVMSERRKMCIYSAVNIDGKRPHKAKRPG